MYATLSQIVYLALSILMTVYVGWSLHRRGKHFLTDVFHDNELLADSVNHLLLVGFYLINLGWVLVWTRYGALPATALEAINYVSTKLGAAMVLLGVVHLVNFKVLWLIRKTGLVTTPTPNPALPPPIRSNIFS